MKHKKLLLSLGCCALALVGGFFTWHRTRDDSGRSWRDWVEDVREARSAGEFWDALTGNPRRFRVRLLLREITFQYQVEARLVTLAQAAAKDAGQDWPLFGGTPQRNMVNLTAKNIPTDWSVEEGKHKNVKWSAELGNKAYGGPVVAGGRVYVGTNNATPRDPKVKGGNKAVLMCFNETDGKFLWQNVHEFPDSEVFRQALTEGLTSTPCIDGDRLYYMTPGCAVVCADAATGKVQWTYDLMKQNNVVPYHTANCSPLVAGELVLVVTGNGTDDEGKVINPKAPSFAAINKKTGKLAWSSDLPGKNILEGQWSNPALATVNGKAQAIFPGGDAYLYSFELETGKLLWKCNCNPKREKKGANNYFVGTPVVVDSRVYVGLGVYPEHPQGTKDSYLVCIDATKKGDVSPKSLQENDPANKNSALVWAFGGPINPAPKRGRAAFFGSTISTCCVVDGLVYAAEERGYLHCLDAKTGQRYYEYDFKASVWGSPYYVDGHVYIGTEDGDIVIFKGGKEPTVVNKVEMGDILHGTPVVANGVLFIATKSKLFAIAGK